MPRKKAPLPSAELPPPFDAFELERLCAYCGYKGTLHGGRDNPHRPFACPASDKAPKWPHSVKNEKKADALYDKRLAKFWLKRKTSFRPIR